MRDRVANEVGDRLLDAIRIPGPSQIPDGFEAELERYGDVSKGTLRFPLSEKLPVSMVKRLVKARAAAEAQKGPLKRR